MTARLAATVLLVGLGLVALPADAAAHAQVEATTPASAAQLDGAPDSVTITFDEPVEASFGALRVYDADGERVDDGELTRPGGESERIATGLADDLGEGGYTVTYRVVSADSHPVSGGFAFTVGQAGAAAESVSELLADDEAPAGVPVAFALARWAGYLALGTALGSLVFLFAVWRPVRERTAGLGGAPADRALSTALRRVVVASCAIGAAAAAVSLPLQASTAAGISPLAALDPRILGELLTTRYGVLGVARLLAWIVLAGVVAAAPISAGATRPRPATALGSIAALPAGPARPALGGLGAIALGVLVLAPALGGHPYAIGPAWLLVPADAVHLIAMSAWFGGLACLAFVFVRATRELAGPAKTATLAATLERFSGLALGAVLALVLSGTLGAIVLLDSPADLVVSAFGRVLLAKAVLLGALVAIGALHRRRLLPGLRAQASASGSPGRAGSVIRRALRAEVGLVAAVLVLSSVLVSLSPSGAGAEGPVSGEAELGDALLDWTVDPGVAGRNQMHLYLFDADSGEQLEGGPAPDVRLTLPDRDIGPLEVELQRAGPGHYVAPAAPFGVRGDWVAEVTLRSSRFEQDEAELEVPIR